MILAPTPEVIVQPGHAVGTLRILGAKPMNLRVPLTQIKNLMVADHVRNFSSNGSLFGGWEPLSPETRSLTGETLVKTGYLKKEIARKSGPGKKVTKYQVRVGVGGEGINRDSFYARFHQSGATEGRKGDLPKREVVGITDRTRDVSIEIIRRYILTTGGRVPPNTYYDSPL